MNIETLKVFKDLIDTQSFTKTAQINYISQSAVSQQIKNLELIFKTRLFIKRKNSFELTDVGKILYKGSNEIIDIYDKTVSRIKDNFDKEIKGEIRISSILSVGIYLLNRYIREFLSKYPLSKISLDYYEWDEVVNKIMEGETDFGFISCKNTKDINLTSLHIDDEEMVFVAPPSFNDFKKERIDISDISGAKLIFFEKNIPSRKFLEEILHKRDVRINVTMEMNNIETIKAAITSNAGFSILPYNCVEDDYNRNKLKVFRFNTPIYRPVYMVYNKRKKFSNSAGLFMNFILESKKNSKEEVLK
ncbi:MAG: LysR family transcriptional regulator [Elusimicrobiales bacterium]|jgi:DNA-binding transcriptional LysR family regulator|nr:LysR family transcriptional regulator [Elusimicrobiales bacterium]